MRTSRPATGTAFALFEFLDRALDSAVARWSLSGRDDPTDPFIPRQRRQVAPGRLRGCVRCEGFAEVRRSRVQGAGLTLVTHHHGLPPRHRAAAEPKRPG